MPLLSDGGGGGGFFSAAGGDLATSTPTSQWVSQISGANGAGGTVTGFFSNFQFANTIVNPTFSVATTSNATAQPTIFQAQASSAASGTVKGFQFIMPDPTGSGNFGTFQIIEGSAVFSQIAVGQGTNTIAYLHLFDPAQGFSPTSSNFWLGMQSGIHQYNTIGTLWTMFNGSLAANTRVETANGTQLFQPGVTQDLGNGIGVLGWSKANTDPNAAPSNTGNFNFWSSVNDSHFRTWAKGGVKTTLASGATAVCLDDLAVGATTTTDATANVTVLTYAIPSGNSGMYMACISGRNTSTNHATALQLIFGAENVGGTVTVNGTPQLILNVANGSNAAMNTVGAPTAAGSSGNLLIRVTGIAATNILWTAKLYALVA